MHDLTWHTYINKWNFEGDNQERGAAICCFFILSPCFTMLYQNHQKVKIQILPFVITVSMIETGFYPKKKKKKKIETLELYNTIKSKYSANHHDSRAKILHLNRRVSDHENNTSRQQAISRLYF